MVAFSKIQQRVTEAISANNYGLAVVGAATVAFFIWSKSRLEEKERK
jgi:hypothetical protein